MTFDRERLEALAGEGWLRISRHPDADLWIYNYTEKTQYENCWVPETLVCRGLILDAEGVVIARPFAKFFNYGTPEIGEIPAEPYVVTEKIDGSLGILYYLDGEPWIATRGSFVSEQAREGTTMIREQEIEHPVDVTPLFEIVYPENRVVVDYGGRRELTLIGAIRHADGRDAPLPRYSGPVVARHEQVDIATLAERARPNSEGFVVSFESGLRVKVKFEEYVRLHRIVTGVNARIVWESLRNGDDLTRLLAGVPDEIYQWVASTRRDLVAAFDSVAMAARDVFEARPDTEDRKTLAQYFLASDANPAVLFRMLDGKEYADLVWKAVRPEPLVPSSARREELAP